MRARDTRCGQLVVAGALTLAVVFISLALVLNGIIYAENLATRSQGDAESRGQYTQEATAASEHLARGVNTNNTDNATYPVLHDRLQRQLTAWDERTNLYAVTAGTTTSVSLRATANGTRLRHTNASRNFSSGGATPGQPTWTLVEGVEREQRIHLNVTRADLFAATLGTTGEIIQQEAFHVSFRNRTGSLWRVYLFQGGITGNMYLVTREPGENLTSDTTWFLEACAVHKRHAHSWVTQGTFGGTDCDELDFFHSIDRPYSITLNRTYIPQDTGDDIVRVRGRYDVLVDRPVREVDLTPYYSATDPDDRSPFAQTALSAAHPRLAVESTKSRYEASATVHPTRFPGVAAGDPPEIRTFDVQDDTNLVTGVEYTASWEVHDPDGDLDSVQVALLNASDHVVDIVATDVSGTDASGSTTVSDSEGSDGDTYEIRLVVHDERGADTSDSVTDTADGTDP